MKGLAIAIGAVLGLYLFSGAGHESIFLGMLAGGLVGYLVAAQALLSSRLRALETSLKDATTPDAPTARAEPAAPSPTASPPPIETPISAAPPETPIAPMLSAPVGTPADSVLPPATPAFIQGIKNFFTGGNAIVRVGVIVLFFGVAFLLKYAVEHQMLPIEARLIGSALGAIVLLAVGWRLRNKRELYALALQGGGIGIFYLTVFTALRLYGLIPAGMAFAILVAVAALSAMLAVLQNARSLAVLAATGGFLAPILTSTGGGDHVLLFGYYVLLNLGILTIAWFKTWRELNLLGFVFTFAIGLLWGHRYYHAELFATTEPFLVVFFVLYVAIAVMSAFRQPPALRGYVDGTIVFGVPLVGFGLQALMVRPYEYGLAWSALAAGGFYLALATALFRRQPTHGRLLTEAFLALGVVFATLAIPLALDARWTAAVWALEGAAIVWVSCRQRRVLGRIFGALLIFGAGLSFARAWDAPIGAWPVLNGFYLGCVLIALAAVTAGFLFARARDDRRDWEKGLSLALLGWGLLWWYGGGLEEIQRQIKDPNWPIGMVAFLAASCVLVERSGARLSWATLRATALGLLPATALLLPGYAYMLDHPFAHAGLFAWALWFGAHYHILSRREDLNGHRYLEALHGATAWLIALLGAWEFSWLASEFIQGASTWALSARGLAPVLVLAAIAALCRGQRWPWRAHRSTYLVLGLLPVAGATWLWSIYSNATGTGAATPLPYLPLLNPLDIVQAGALLAAVAWFEAYSRVAEPRAVPDQRRLFAGIAGATAFAWLTAMLLRSLHHWAGVPFAWQAMLDSTLVQASLSIFWTVIALALMVTATRWGRRALWVAGAGLLGFVVLKLFIIDLARTGTVARIVSFIVVGVLLLLIGYFTPVPPRAQKTESPA